VSLFLAIFGARLPPTSKLWTDVRLSAHAHETAATLDPSAGIDPVCQLAEFVRHALARSAATWFSSSGRECRPSGVEHGRRGYQGQRRFLAYHRTHMLPGPASSRASSPWLHPVLQR